MVSSYCCSVDLKSGEVLVPEEYHGEASPCLLRSSSPQLMGGFVVSKFSKLKTRIEQFSLFVSCLHQHPEMHFNGCFPSYLTESLLLFYGFSV